MATQKVDFDVLAHDKASDKLDRIARAFRKLKNDSDNVDGDGLTDLSKKLRKVADDFEKEGNRSGKGFGSGLKKWVTGGGKGIGSDFGTVFGSGFLGAVKTPILGPALIAALGGAVAVAAPAVGAIAASGITAGFGAGLAGLGVVFAAKSEAVQRGWSKTLAAMGAEMRVLSQPFESTLLSMAVVARRTFGAFAPELAKSFRKIAPALTEFGDQLGRAFEGLVPVVEPLGDAFVAVLKSLGPAMQGAVRNIAAGLQGLAESVKKSPDGLADLVDGFGKVARAGIDLIAKLNDINAAFDRVFGASATQVVFDGIAGSVKGVQLAFEAVTTPITGADKLMQKFGLSSKDAGTSTVNFSDSLLKTAEALGAAGPQVESLATKFARQAAATQRANEALFRQQNLLLTLSGSQIGYEAAVDDATASLKENGKTLDIGTAKGRANKTALDTLATSANSVTEALRNNGDGNVKAAKHAEGARANFVKLAVQMGATVPEAKRMAAQMIAIPNVSRTAKLNANKKDLETKLAAAKRELASKDLTKERRAQLNATIKKLEAGVAAAKRALASVPASKTVTITTRLVTERISRTVSGPAGGHVPTEKRASGGPVRRDTPYLVGEEGPETFVPSASGFIVPNGGAKTSSAPVMAASGGAQRLELVIRADSGSRYASFLATELSRLLQARGADVTILRKLGLA